MRATAPQWISLSTGSKSQKKSCSQRETRFSDCIHKEMRHSPVRIRRKCQLTRRSWRRRRCSNDWPPVHRRRACVRRAMDTWRAAAMLIEATLLLALARHFRISWFPSFAFCVAQNRRDWTSPADSSHRCLVCSRLWQVGVLLQVFFLIEFYIKL